MLFKGLYAGNLVLRIRYEGRTKVGLTGDNDVMRHHTSQGATRLSSESVTLTVDSYKTRTPH